MKFLGFQRSDGSVGVRNLTAVMSTVMCSNEVSESIAKGIDGAVAVTHGHGCCQLPPDLQMVEATLTSIALNPNVANTLLVSLGCEGVRVEAIAEGIASSGRTVEVVRIQELGGMERAVAEGRKACEGLRLQAARAKRSSLDWSELVIGVKCGSSDATSGLVTNPAVGRFIDDFVAHGGSAIFGETTEFIGAEHLLARRGRTPDVQARIIEIVTRMEERCKSAGVDMRMGQPTPGNIRGGITTIEEKSLGAISKSGTAPIDGVLQYGERTRSKGLYIVDSPGREPELLTGLVACGAVIILFSTGLGAPQGHPVAPVIKVVGNGRTAAHLCSHIDVDVSSAMIGASSLDDAAEMIRREVGRVASGGLTKAEVLGYNRFLNIYTFGPVI